MKKRSHKVTKATSDEIRPEYDFTGGVRGKHYKARQRGYTIRIYKLDGTIFEQYVAGKDAITLAPDVLEYFPNSKAVNHALRTLIALVPAKPKKAADL